MTELGSIIDLKRYPIDKLDSKEGQNLVSQCWKELELDGSLLLEGFVRGDVIEKMAAEVSNLESYHRLQIVNPYLFGPRPADVPEDYPTKHMIAQDVHAVAADRIPSKCLLRRVYDAPAVLDFLARVLRLPALFQFEDVLQCINVMYMKDGGSRAWHYDGSDFVVTLLLQQCLDGGEFEWAPFIRGAEGEENYDKVRQLFDGSLPAAKTSRAQAGALSLFSGRRSMHRVRAVYGPKIRIQSVLSYDTLPPDKQKLPTAEKNVSLYGERARAVTMAALRARNKNVAKL